MQINIAKDGTKYGSLRNSNFRDECARQTYDLRFYCFV